MYISLRPLGQTRNETGPVQLSSKMHEFGEREGEEREKWKGEERQT